MDVFSDHGMDNMSMIITIAAILGSTAVILSSIMGEARILRALSKDGLIPSIFGYMDPITKVPTKAAWLSSIAGAFACAFLNLDTLATLAAVSNLICYAFINLAVVIMRLQDSPRNNVSNNGKFLFVK